MSDVVIAVRNLSKQYRLGAKEKQADTFFGSLKNLAAAPFRNYKQIRNLTRSNLDDDSLFWALRDINFEVKRGEVLGIIGHNGAGKSTLLKILSRITDPTSGEIKIKGRVSALLEIGTGFHPELTGRENVYMNGTILGMTKKEIDKKFDEIVDFSGIERHVDTPVKFYSSGMKVRLAFAVAAHLEPELLIIDEVLAVGDAEFQKKCLGKMEDIAKNGRTVLFVSHNLDAVKGLCSRAVLLNKGRLDLNDNVVNVINRYISNYKVNILSRNFDKSNAPGVTDLTLLSAALISDSSEGILTIDTALKFIFNFHAEQPFTDFNLSLVLWSISGTCVFNTVTPVYSISRGDHRSELVIPGGLLNNDIYSIELYFVNKSMKLFKVSELLVFELMDAPRNVIKYSKWIGVVRPNLSFTIDNYIAP
jgi:lipopolysaccharide transport system ATP-binding protein